LPLPAFWSRRLDGNGAIWSRRISLQPNGTVQIPFSTTQAEEFGELPLTEISSAVSTTTPPDEGILRSTGISGTDAFEEIVNLDGIEKIPNPLKEQLWTIVQGHGLELSPKASAA
jgi:hypothetical protein